MIRVLLADDQAMVRTGFEMILGMQDDIEVVASVADGAAALDSVRDQQPDVALLDIRMPRIDGLEVCRRISDRVACVIVITFHDDAYVDATLDNGAVGFLLKVSGPALLVDAVRAAAKRQALISPEVTTALLERRTRPAEPLPELSEREFEVARAVARGRSNQEIADELFISLSTVKTHIANIQQRLAVRNRVEIAARLWASGTMD